MANIIQIRRDTAANWTAANPTLAQGEPALEIDTKKEKLGDGYTAWNDLAYKAGGGDMNSNIYDQANKAEQVLTIGDKGVANGVATLDGSSKIPSAQLPAYVDDVLEYDDLASFPPSGETGKIYVAKDTNKNYRWSGSAYVVMNDLDAAAIKALYEGNANTNAFTDALLAKLNSLRPITVIVATGLSGVYDINMNQGIKWDLQFSAAGSINFTALVRDADTNEIILRAGTVPNFATYVNPYPDSPTVDGARDCKLVFDVENANAGSEEIYYFVTYIN